MNDSQQQSDNGTHNQIDKTQRPASDTQRAMKVPNTPRAEPNKSGRSSTVLGSLALVVAFAALIGCGYLYYRLVALDTAVDNRASEQQQRITELDVRPQLARLGARIDALVQDIGRQYSANSAHVDELQNAVRALQAIGSRSDRAWVIAETRYLLKMSQHRLVLAGDLDSAVAAARAADAQLHQLADISLLPVRAALAVEIALLRSTAKPDIEGKVLALMQLARRSNTLPLKAVHRDPGAAPQPIQSDEVETAEVNGVGTDILQFVQRYIVIKPAPTRTATLPDLALTGAETLSRRATLQLALQEAQIATLRRDQADFLAATTSASDLLSEHFNTDDELVQRFVADLDSIGQSPVRPKVEGIGEALRLLNKIENEAKEAS